MLKCRIKMMLSLTCSLYLCSTIAFAVIICEYNITITIFDVDASEIGDISCDGWFDENNGERCDTVLKIYDGNGKYQGKSNYIFMKAVYGKVTSQWENSIIFDGNIDLSSILTIKLYDQNENKADLELCKIDITQSNMGLATRSCVPTWFTNGRTLRFKTTIHLIKQRCNFSTTTGASTTMDISSTQTSQNSTNLVNTSFFSTHHSTTHRFQLRNVLLIVGVVLIAMAVAFVAGIVYFWHRRGRRGRQVHNVEQDSAAFADTQLVSRSELSTKRSATVSLFGDRTLPYNNMTSNTTLPCNTTAAVSSDRLNLNTLPTTGRIAYPSLISTRTGSDTSLFASKLRKMPATNVPRTASTSCTGSRLRPSPSVPSNSRTILKTVPKPSASNSLFSTRRGRESDLMVKPTTSFATTQTGYSSKTSRSSVSASSKASRQRDRYAIAKTPTSNVCGKPIQRATPQRYQAKPCKEKPIDNAQGLKQVS